MKWRLIGPERRTGHMNLALEEACMESVGSGKSPPTLFFYEWENPAVIVGHFQKVQEEVNVGLCEADGIHVIRRITGGGAMYQDNKAMTFGWIAPDALASNDINENYRNVCGKVVDALGLLGIESEFKPINDIIVQGKKVSGSALTKRSGATMVHGTLLHTLDVEKMFSYLNVSDEKISDKFIASVLDRVTSISHHKEVPRHAVYSALEKAFLDGKEYSVGSWSSGEFKRAEELVVDRYANPKWVHLR